MKYYILHLYENLHESCKKLQSNFEIIETKCVFLTKGYLEIDTYRSNRTTVLYFNVSFI